MIRNLRAQSPRKPSQESASSYRQTRDPATLARTKASTYLTSTRLVVDDTNTNQIVVPFDRFRISLQCEVSSARVSRWKNSGISRRRKVPGIAKGGKVKLNKHTSRLKLIYCTFASPQGSEKPRARAIAQARSRSRSGSQAPLV